MSDRIGRHYYDSSGYFEAEAAAHVADLDSTFQRHRIRKVLELCAPRATDRVVDLGCGWGTFELVLADRVAEVVGVDFSAKSIDYCRARVAERSLQGVRFVCADAGDTGLDGGSYDLVIAADLFEHLYPDDSVRVAREAFRLLCKGGRVATWTPHAGHLLEVLKRRDLVFKHDPSHVDYKSMARMKALLSEAGFTIERAYYAESHVPGLRMAERALQRWIPLLRRRIAVLGRKPGR